MSNYFKPDNKNIRKIFSDSIYKIPNYQRQYSWGDEQLEDLWEDLYEAYKNKEECYFLGSIVYVNNNDGYLELIDGQQRITTLMIMMSVLFKNFSEINSNRKNQEELNTLDVDKEILEQCIFFKTNKERLQLQTDPKYNEIFKTEIFYKDSFERVKKPTKKEFENNDPKYKYINTSYFFYNKFKSLEWNELEKFVNFIFFHTNIITIECENKSFAIKLFQVMNDRGLNLSSSDIIKSYLISKIKEDPISENIIENFNNVWKEIEDLSKDNEYNIDDFFVYYQYFKIKSNPKKQIIDEMKNIIKKENIDKLINEMSNFNNSLKEMLRLKNPAVLALRYVPWKFYSTTALISALYVKYDETELNELYKLLRRFFYICFVAGLNLNGVKQTSFNIIKEISEKQSITKIAEIIQDFFVKQKIFSKFYNSIDDDVYGQKFLKPLMLSLEYELREEINTEFYEIKKNIHLDHILPIAFSKEEKWEYINNEEIEDYINKIGNLALLYKIKNEEASNKGFEEKIQIYEGKNKSYGVTSFETTKWLISNFNKNKQMWNIDLIKERQEKLIQEIEKMLCISREDINIKPTLDKNKKWEYKGKEYNYNKDFIYSLLNDYIIDNNIKSFEEIPSEIATFKMYSQDLISQNKKSKNYEKIEINNMILFFGTVFYMNHTEKFLEFFKNYYSFEYVKK